MGQLPRRNDNFGHSGLHWKAVGEGNTTKQTFYITRTSGRAFVFIGGFGDGLELSNETLGSVVTSAPTEELETVVESLQELVQQQAHDSQGDVAQYGPRVSVQELADEMGERPVRQVSQEPIQEPPQGNW